MKLEDVVAKFSKASLCVCADERPLLMRACEFLKAYLADAYETFVKSHWDDPLLQSYQADATPMWTRKRQVLNIENSTYQREHAEHTEWYNLRCTVSCIDAAGQWHCKCMLRDPIAIPSKVGGLTRLPLG